MRYPNQGSDVLMRNKYSSVNASRGFVPLVTRGRSHISSMKTRDFLEIVLTNSNSKSQRITMHPKYFPPMSLKNQDIIHGVRVYVNSSCTDQDVVMKHLDHDDCD